VEEVGTLGTALALFDDPELHDAAVELAPGEVLCVFTDGLVEARDGTGEFFPLAEYADELGDGTVEEALDRLVARLLAYAGQEMNDDMALVLAERTGA
jgi:serine phosphatase RsbU (regulator of sigma subunit)